MLDTEIHTAGRPARADGRRSGASSEDAVAVKLQALAEMDYDALRAEWRRLYRAQAPKRVSRDLLMLGVAWKRGKAARHTGSNRWKRKPCWIRKSEAPSRRSGEDHAHRRYRPRIWARPWRRCNRVLSGSIGITS